MDETIRLQDGSNGKNQSYITGWSLKHLMTKYHDNIFWINNVLNHDYSPDINYIVEIYYKTLVSNESYKKKKTTNTIFNDTTENEGGISKRYLSREYATDPESDLTNIVYLLYMDVLLKMFNDVMKTYYKHFSWEQISEKPLMERYNDHIFDLQAQIEILTSQLDNQNKRNNLLEARLLTENDSTVKPYITEINKQLKELELKDQKISELKSKLNRLEEFISLKEAKEESSNVISIDVNHLQQKKYLFVGHESSLMKALKKQFPNSIFMETETFDISRIKIDGVVLLIKYMNHAMYYKILSSNFLRNLPIIRVNTQNIKKVYQEMYHGIIEEN